MTKEQLIDGMTRQIGNFDAYEINPHSIIVAVRLAFDGWRYSQVIGTTPDDLTQTWFQFISLDSLLNQRNIVEYAVLCDYAEEIPECPGNEIRKTRYAHNESYRYCIQCKENGYEMWS